jgi:predicted Zn finger-like uncharacterized protein
MNVACSSCPAKYAVPDEKVRGRKVRITCKRCGAGIIVDGTGLATGAASDAAPSPAASESAGAGAAAAPAAAPPAEPAPAAAPPPVASAASTGAAQEPTPKPTNDEPAVVGAAANAAASPEPAAEPAPAAKPAVAAKPVTGVIGLAKSAEPKAVAFPKPGLAAKGPTLGSPLGGAASKATSPVAAAATAGKATAVTPGKAAPQPPKRLPSPALLQRAPSRVPRQEASEVRRKRRARWFQEPSAQRLPRSRRGRCPSGPGPSR